VDWIALAYSLPARSAAGRRVTTWRRLRRLGAVGTTGALYFLPRNESTAEAFGWLAQEIADGGGEAMVLPIACLDGATEERLVSLSREARNIEYRGIARDAAALAKRPIAGPRQQAAARDSCVKLERRCEEVSRVDFFAAPEGPAARAALGRLHARLETAKSETSGPAALKTGSYQGRTWVTRPRPHVDRLASAWLIRRFIDPGAAIRYGTPQPGEISFDTPGATFGHHGDRCSFETLIAAFGLDDPALAPMAEIVHTIDLQDDRSRAPEIPGLDRVLRGWLTAGLSDQELERHGIVLFEGLYASLRHPVGRAASSVKKQRRSTGRKRRPRATT
jgi:hypothetical protein